MSMNRRDFLGATAAAGAALALSSVGAVSASAAAPRHKIRRGVAMYSFQEEYFVRQMTVEDCLREMSDIGANGMELLAEMMVPNFPNPPTAWVDQWHGWIEKYRIQPACYTQFIDSLRTKTHTLSVEEGVQTMLRDIRLAKLLGIPRVRALIGTPVDILEATVPHMEKENIWVGVELHFPIPIRGRLVERLMKIAEKTDHFGFVPDMGIFQNKPNPYARDRMIRDGALTRAAAEFIENAWENDKPKDAVLAEVAKMDGGPAATGYVHGVYMIKAQNPRDLIPIMSKCRHIHGKTWGLTEDDKDPAIDLGPVIPALIDGGFDGVIATEYEGQRHVQDIDPFTSVEMIRRHHVMLRRLLGEIA
ncbi:MAG: twin-arginine translocation signal domain-containing protein [Steroidobacteraceae bacterium]